MKKSVLLIAVLSLAMGLAAQKQNPTYLAYIDEWKGVAVQNQGEYGIPASIIMAQALLESAAGTSELAVNARNHFGIKCTSDWFGGVYYYDDDSKGECFRQYANAAESFKDHAKFLLRPRYSTCFEIAIEDYEGWAYRLKACGYATDKNYAPKLIKIIEDYRLDTLGVTGYGLPVTGDSIAVTGYGLPVTGDSVAVTGYGVPITGYSLAQPAAKPKRSTQATVVHRTEPIAVIHHDPEPEYVAPLTAKQERDSFFFMHPKMKCNGVTFVEAREGDTYANVAFRLNVRERELREDNDALGRELQPGDRIYLSAKKMTGSQTFVWSVPGQSLWQMSQEQGVQVAAILKWNEIDPSVRVFRTRQKIYLCKVKEQ